MVVLVIHGSLREKSLSKTLALATERLAPERMVIELSGIEGFPLYDDIIEKTAYPEVATKLKDKISSANGIIIITPEYNRSMPGALKNVFDWISRPSGSSLVWKQKPVGVIGASNGVRGASFAQYDVKRILAYFDAHVMGQPEFYLGEADRKMKPDGTITDEKAKDGLRAYLEAFRAHVARFNSASVPPSP